MALGALAARMDEAGVSGEVPAPVLRALANLRVAVQLRLRQGPLAPERAAALDAAAPAVERS